MVLTLTDFAYHNVVSATLVVLPQEYLNIHDLNIFISLSVYGAIN